MSCRRRSCRAHGTCMVIAYSKRTDQPDKVANPARGPQIRENDFSQSPFAPANLASRDGSGSPAPRQPARLHTQAESGAYLRDSSRVPRRRPCNHLNRHPPSGLSRPSLLGHAIAYRWRCSLMPRVRTGTVEPVKLFDKVVPNVCCLGRSPWTN